MDDILQEFDTKYCSSRFKLDGGDTDSDQYAYHLSWPSVIQKNRHSISTRKNEIGLNGLIKTKDENIPIKTRIVNNLFLTPACPPYISAINVPHMNFLYTIHAHYYGGNTTFSRFDMDRYQPKIQNKHLLFIWWVLTKGEPKLATELLIIIFVEYILLL